MRECISQEEGVTVEYNLRSGCFGPLSHRRIDLLSRSRIHLPFGANLNSYKVSLGGGYMGCKQQGRALWQTDPLSSASEWLHRWQIRARKSLASFSYHPV